eukprot:1089767-Pyramimonas_sp.AAC.2
MEILHTCNLPTQQADFQFHATSSSGPLRVVQRGGEDRWLPAQSAAPTGQPHGAAAGSACPPRLARDADGGRTAQAMAPCDTSPAHPSNAALPIHS